MGPHVSARLRGLFVLLGCMLGAAGIALGQSGPVSPQGAHHTTVGPGAGLGAPVSPTGGYAAEVPLDLPAPRGPLPVPLSIVYTGSSRAGAAGAGWDVPLSYVRRSRTPWRRKPAATPDGSVSAAERVHVSLGGGTQLMVPKGDVYVPYAGSEYSELRQDGDSWRLRTLDNLEYRFAPSSSLGTRGDPDLWMLVEIRDLTGTDKVVLRYGAGSCGDFQLTSIAHTFGPTIDQQVAPLYVIDLAYARWGEICSAFDVSYIDGVSFGHAEVLARVAVTARNNLDPAAPPRAIRTYHLSYETEPDTRKPRLASVDVAGEAGTTTPPLPVARYGYGALSAAVAAPLPGHPERVVRFGGWQPIARPAALAWIGFDDDLATTDVYRYDVSGHGDWWWVRGHVETTRARHLMRDFTGDGVPDLLYRHGGTWMLHPARLTPDGVTYDTTPTMWDQGSGPNEVHVQSTFSFAQSTASGLGAPPQLGDDPGRFAREALITTETWNEFIDWNGDGRVDVVDVKGGQTANHWKIWLNEPDPSAAVRWRPIQVDLGPVRADLASRGLQRDDFSYVFPSLDWSDRLPTQRTRSWPRLETIACNQNTCEKRDGVWRCWPNGSECTQGSSAETFGTDSVTEWQLSDVNEDGFPDIVANEQAVQYCESNGRTGNLALHNETGASCSPYNEDPHGFERYFDEVNEYYCAEIHREWLTRESDCTGQSQTRGVISFLNRAGPYTGTSGSPFASGPSTSGGVVSQWTTAEDGAIVWIRNTALAMSSSWQAVGLDDRFGTGQVTSRQFDRSESAQFETDRHLRCPSGEYPHPQPFESRQTRALIDLNGDGLADLVDATRPDRATVRFNNGVNGVAWTAWTEIEEAPGGSFEISKSTGSCDGDDRTIAGLMDLDGDGKPELVRTDGGELQMSRLLPSEGENLHAVGRLTRIENGHGGVVHLTYGNAKQLFQTKHAVPFPEIVLTRSQTSTLDASAPAMEPTYFAYGVAELEYDPLAGRWVFPGYRRHVVLSGTPYKDGWVQGVAAVSENAPPAVAGSPYPFHVQAHRPICQGFHEGTFNTQSFLDAPCTGEFGEVRTAYGSQLVVAPSVVDPVAALECGDLDPATGQPFGYGRCGSAGVVYAASTEAWEGLAAPPALTNTLARTGVIRVDAYGRPVELRNEGDVRRPGDDVCTNIDYAEPADGGPFPTVPASIELTDCGIDGPEGQPRTIAATHLRYDGLPAGEVGRGRLTGRLVDRYEGTTYVATHEQERLTYDALGMVDRVERPRGLGTATTVTTRIFRDAFGATVTASQDRATDLATTLDRAYFESTWPSLGVSMRDEQGVTTLQDLDGHGRVVRERAIGRDGTETTLRRVSYAPDGRSVTAESFPETTPPGTEDTAPRQRATTVFDALLRPRFTQSALGGDYGGQTVVSGLVDYDPHGRVAFVAEPFPWSATPFVPGTQPGQVRGVTSVFDLRGRIVRQIEQLGRDEAPLSSSVAGDTYVTKLQYGYEHGRALVWRQGPDETDPSSTRSLHYDQVWRTATGQEIERARFDATGKRLDLVRQEWDRLGRLVTTNRYVDPATGVVPVAWHASFDSLGRRLSMTEPGMATQRTTYDEHGNPLEAWWTDGVLRHITRASYDGFGRVTEQLLVRAAPGGETIESHTRFHYDQHSGHADQDGVVLPGALSWAETKAVGAVYHTYDPFGRARATTYRYDGYPHAVREHADYTAPGRLEYLLLDTGETTDAVGYEYDSAGRVARVTDAFTGTPYWRAASVEFDGFRAAIELGNGIVETYSREATGRRRPTGWKVPTAQGTFSGRAIEFDAAGRVIHEELVTPEGSERRGYAFDGLGRLSKAVHLGGRWPGTEAYAHDALGNLTARTATSGLPDRTFEQDPQDPDRLCRVNASGGGPCELTYDGAGNVVADLSYGATQPRHLAYDAGGRITSITRGPYGASMTYGPAGRATLEVDGFHQRTHFYFGGLVEIRYLGAKAGFERRIPGPGGVVATRRLSTVGDTTVYHHGDGRANRVFTDAAAQLVQQVDYTNFGQAVSTASGPDSLQSDDLWNGGDDLPELGLVLLGPRAYDPDLGRFLQRDPIAITARASTANPYAFSFSDPINFADPSGLSPEGTRTWQQHQAWGPMAGAMTGLFWLQFSGDIKRRPPRPTRPRGRLGAGRGAGRQGVGRRRRRIHPPCTWAPPAGARAKSGAVRGPPVAPGSAWHKAQARVPSGSAFAPRPSRRARSAWPSTTSWGAPEGVRGVTQLGGALVDDPVGTVVTLASDPELADEVLFDAVLTKKVGPGVLTRPERVPVARASRPEPRCERATATHRSRRSPSASASPPITPPARTTPSTTTSPSNSRWTPRTVIASTSCSCATVTGWRRSEPSPAPPSGSP